ncbi:MAG: hypothetical protein SNF68_06035 [Rikenellaceae bacterium]
MRERDRGYEEFIADLAGGLRYSPRLGKKWSANWRYDLGAYALISPAAVSDKEGVERGRVSYDIEFTLLKCHSQKDIMAISMLWNDVKRDAMEIVHELERSPLVLATTELEIEPLSLQISNYDEVAVQVSATMVSNYIAGGDGSL